MPMTVCLTVATPPVATGPIFLGHRRSFSVCPATIATTDASLGLSSMSCYPLRSTKCLSSNSILAVRNMEQRATRTHTAGTTRDTGDTEDTADMEDKADTADTEALRRSHSSNNRNNDGRNIRRDGARDRGNHGDGVHDNRSRRDGHDRDGHDRDGHDRDGHDNDDAVSCQPPERSPSNGRGFDLLPGFANAAALIWGYSSRPRSPD
jgi:hypothetical protein